MHTQQQTRSMLVGMFTVTCTLRCESNVSALTHVGATAETSARSWFEQVLPQDKVTQ
jgi:hypothetical protein